MKYPDAMVKHPFSPSSPFPQSGANGVSKLTEKKAHNETVSHSLYQKDITSRQSRMASPFRTLKKAKGSLILIVPVKNRKVYSK